RLLEDLAAEAREGGLDLRLGRQLARVATQRAPLGVERVGLLAEADRPRVALRAALEEGRELRRLAHGERQHAGGERVERAAVADARGAEPTPRGLDGVVRRPAAGLVDDEEAGRPRPLVRAPTRPSAHPRSRAGARACARRWP